MDDFRPMTEQEIKLGRMVRQVWLDYCKLSRLSESHSHSAPWEELTLWEKNVDERIGTALFDAGYAAAEAELSRVAQAARETALRAAAELCETVAIRDDVFKRQSVRDTVATTGKHLADAIRALARSAAAAEAQPAGEGATLRVKGGE